MQRSMDLTAHLEKWITENDQASFELAVSQLHGDLKRAAHTRRSSFPNSALQTTELLNEAFLKLIPLRQKLTFQSRQHFINLVSKAIERFLLEEIRQRKAAKRDGDTVGLEVMDSESKISFLENDLAILQALNRAREEDPILYQVIHFRHFMGLTIAETSEVLKIPKIAVNRKWAFAKAWLYEQMTHRPSFESL